jgi:DNA adenine methylase|tara:strand:- start:3776 stop:4627 length:852 start_codon:yes stop_codon:yes gene_type:complete
LLDDLLPLIPYDEVFVDVFGGGGSVLLNRHSSPVEVYNDLDGNLVNLFRVMQHPQHCVELERRLRSTLYSKSEFVKAIAIIRGDAAPSDDIERAWAMFVNMNQSVVGRVIRTQGNWARAAISVSGESAVIAGWKSIIRRMPQMYQRLSQVMVEDRDAIECVEYWDGPDTVLYVDPPYVHDTRVEANYYAHEMTNEQHESLIAALIAAQGRVVVSGYDHPIYNQLDEKGWDRVEIETVTHMTASQRSKGEGWDRESKPRGERTEVIWLNPQATTNRSPSLLEML